MCTCLVQHDDVVSARLIDSLLLCLNGFDGRRVIGREDHIDAVAGVVVLGAVNDVDAGISIDRFGVVASLGAGLGGGYGFRF